MPVMQELLRLRDAGDLTPAQAQWFRASKEVDYIDLLSLNLGLAYYFGAKKVR